MNLLNRATISIKRRLGKSLILLLLVIVLASAISGAISVTRAISNTEANLRRNMPALVSMELDGFRNWDFESRTAFINDVVNTIGALPYVDFFDYSQFHNAHSLCLRRYESDYLVQQNIAWEMTTPAPGEGFDFNSLRGFSNPRIVCIEAGEFEFIAGRTFTETELSAQDRRFSVAIISRQMAEHNNIWVGDTVVVSLLIDSDHALPAREQETIDYELEIIGIRDFIDRPDIEGFSDRIDDEMNQIFVPNWFIDLVALEAYENVPWILDNPHATPFANFFPYYVLTDAKYLDEFLSEARRIAAGTASFDDSSSRFAAVIHSTATIVDVTNVMLHGAIGAAIIVLTLTITLFLHDRRHEIGIYLSLGERKIVILTQFLAEILIIAVTGISIALFIGNVISTRISQAMILDEILAYEEVNKNEHAPSGLSMLEISFGYPLLTHEDMLEAFDTSLSFELLILFYAIGLGVVVMSTFIPVVYVLTLKPRKVLL